MANHFLFKLLLFVKFKVFDVWSITMLSKPTVFYVFKLLDIWASKTSVVKGLLKPFKRSNFKTSKKCSWLTLSAYTIFSTHVDVRVPPPSHFSDNAAPAWPLSSPSKSNPPLPSERVSNYQRCSGESTSLPPMSPCFKFRRGRHMWLSFRWVSSLSR